MDRRSRIVCRPAPGRSSPLMSGATGWQPDTARSSESAGRAAWTPRNTLPARSRSTLVRHSKSATCISCGCLAPTRLCRPELGREFGPEVLGLEHLANLDLGLPAREGIRAALDPLDGFFLRLHLKH